MLIENSVKKDEKSVETLTTLILACRIIVITVKNYTIYGGLSGVDILEVYY